MLVTIETQSGKEYFPLTARQATSLLNYARKLAAEKDKEAPPANGIANKTCVDYFVRMSEQPQFSDAVQEREERRRRREARIAEGNENGYGGFLACECQSCGRMRTFRPKTPIKEYVCKCGERTPLKDLLGAYAECSCGEKWYYKTNCRDDAFGIICMNCGKPIPLIRNAAGTGFNSVGGGTWQR